MLIFGLYNRKALGKTVGICPTHQRGWKNTNCDITVEMLLDHEAITLERDFSLNKNNFELAEIICYYHKHF